MNSIKKLDAKQLYGEPIHIKESFSVIDIGLHWHSYYELIYYYEGETVSRINGTNLDLCKGSLYLITPLDLHHTYTKESKNSTHFINISFTEEMIDHELVEKLQQVLFLHNLSEDSPILSLISLLKNSKESREKRHLLNALLCRLVTEGKYLSSVSGVVLPDSIRKGIQYTITNFKTPISLKDVAQAVHLNASYFSDLFSKTYGCTFKTYLTALRLGYAKQLLRSTNLSVTEISALSGFQSMPHFMRTFKEKEGKTPMQFRNTQ